MNNAGVSSQDLRGAEAKPGSRGLFSSLRTRMLVTFGFLGVGILIALELAHLYGLPFTSLNGEYQRHRDLAFRQLSLTADVITERLSSWIERRHDHALVVAESSFVRQAVGELVGELHRLDNRLSPAERVRTILAALPLHQALTHDLILTSMTDEPYLSVEVADAASGVIFASSHADDLGFSVWGQGCFTNMLRSGATVFTGVERDPESGQLTLVVSRPILVEGIAGAVLILRINPRDALFAGINTWAELEQTGEAVLVNEDGLLLAPPELPLPDGSRARSLIDRLSGDPAKAAAGREGIFVSRDYRGVPVLAACRSVQIGPTRRWGLVVKQDQARIFASVRQSEELTLVAGLIGLGLLLGLSGLTANRLNRPILQLSEVARQVAAGDLAARASVRPRGEIGMLAGTFNAMVERIQHWHEALEAEVRKRTTDLEQVNSSLQAEIAGRRHAEDALRRQRDNFRRLLDSMAGGVYVVNSKFDIQYVNPVLEKEFGPVAGRKCHEYFHDRQAACPWCQHAAVMGGQTVRWEWQCARTGKTYDLLDTPLDNRDGSRSKLEIFRDITERKRVEVALRQSEERFRTVADFTYDWEFWVSPDKQFVYMSPSCARITGYTREEFAREPELFSRIVHPEDCRVLTEHLAGDMAQQGPCELEFRIQRRDGQERWIAHVCQAVWDDQGGFLGRRASNRDITERKLAEEALRRARDELELKVCERTAELVTANSSLQAEIGQRKSLEARIVEISEYEQRRIGRDLHDGLCQHLTGLAHLCNATCHKLAQVVPEEVETLRRTGDLVHQALAQAHNLARGLFPVSLQADGLMMALEQLVLEFKTMYPAAISFVCEPPVLIEDNATSTHLYRIAQEALSNALKHSHCSAVTVTLSADARARRLSVCDNGGGLPDHRPQSTGLGLDTMRFRARAIGAHLEIKSRTHGGTEVICTLSDDNQR
ncbi:MAG TPA: PAS domain S-box protein [Verrucomicrobiae bacterium]